MDNVAQANESPAFRGLMINSSLERVNALEAVQLGYLPKIDKVFPGPASSAKSYAESSSEYFYCNIDSQGNPYGLEVPIPELTVCQSNQQPKVGLVGFGTPNFLEGPVPIESASLQYTFLNGKLVRIKLSQAFEHERRNVIFEDFIGSISHAYNAAPYNYRGGDKCTLHCTLFDSDGEYSITIGLLLAEDAGLFGEARKGWLHLDIKSTSGMLQADGLREEATKQLQASIKDRQKEAEGRRKQKDALDQRFKI